MLADHDLEAVKHESRRADLPPRRGRSYNPDLRVRNNAEYRITRSRHGERHTGAGDGRELDAGEIRRIAVRAAGTSASIILPLT